MQVLQTIIKALFGTGGHIHFFRFGENPLSGTIELITDIALPDTITRETYFRSVKPGFAILRGFGMNVPPRPYLRKNGLFYFRISYGYRLQDQKILSA
jgi:hypothetical protein